MPANGEGINSHCKMVLLCAEMDRDRKQWEDACSRNFSVEPVTHHTDSSYKITLLQLKGVAPDEIAFFTKKVS